MVAIRCGSHHVKADGSKTGILFRGREFSAAPGEQNEHFSVLMETTCVGSILELRITLSVPQILQA